MKKEMKSFLLRMAVVLLVLGAICFVGAYGAGKLCAEMLLTPACAALAYAAYQAEKKPVPSRAQSDRCCALLPRNRHPCVLHDWAQDGKDSFTGIDDSRVKK